MEVQAVRSRLILVTLLEGPVRTRHSAELFRLHGENVKIVVEFELAIGCSSSIGIGFHVNEA